MKMTGSSIDPLESLRTNNGWAVAKRPDPKVDSTAQFYKDAGKTPKYPVLVANQRQQQLEKEQWTDNVWLGDNVDVTAKLTHQAVTRDERMHAKKGTYIGRTVGYGLQNKFTQLA
jgi:hypothetical protein